MTVGTDQPDLPSSDPHVVVERFWRPPDIAFQLDDDGFLTNWQHPYAGRWLRSTLSLADERCLVLLGEPGTGKTTALTVLDDHPPADVAEQNVLRIDLRQYRSEDRLVREIFGGPRLRHWQAGEDRLCLRLDSFDECRLHIGHLATLIADQLAGLPVGRMWVRLACRTSEWPSSLGAALKDLFGSVTVVEMLPLRRHDVIQLAVEAGHDPEQFLASVHQANVGPLASRPLTLKLLLRAFDPDQGLPGGAVALYDRGLLALSEEWSARRRDSGTAGTFTPHERTTVAARLAGYTVLCGMSALWTGSAASVPDGLLSVEACAGGTEPRRLGAEDAVGEFEVSAKAVRETLGTGLFSGRGEHRIGWAHQTFGDYLAARYLLTRFSDDQVRNLVTSGGTIVVQLREVAAWLVAMAPTRFGSLAVNDPAAFLSAAADAEDPELRAAITAGLFSALETGALPEVPPDARLSRLCHPTTDDQVKPHLASGDDAARSLAFRIVSACHLAGLRSEVATVTLDPAATRGMRIVAGLAFQTLAAGDGRELRPLVLSPIPDDVDDSLFGIALKATWPGALSRAELFAALRRPRSLNHFGPYEGFLMGLPRTITAGDLPAALDWLLAQITADDPLRFPDAFEMLADHIVALSFSSLEDPDIRRRLARVAVIWGRSNLPLLRRSPIVLNPPTEPTPSDDQRRLLLRDMIAVAGDDGGAPFLIIAARLPTTSLLNQSDLAWLVKEFDHTSDETRRLVGQLVRFTLSINDASQASIILDLPVDHPLRTEVLRDVFEPIALDSDLADQLRRSWAATTNAPPRHPSEDDDIAAQAPTLRHTIDQLLDAGESGDGDAFWKANVALANAPGSRYSRENGVDLTTLPAWPQLTDRQKERLVASATEYLRQERPADLSWLGGARQRPFDASYRAFVLLMRLLPTQLDRLGDEVWQQWAPALLEIPVLEPQDIADKARLLAHARPHALDQLVAALVELARHASTSGAPGLFRATELQALQGPQLATQLAALLHEPLLAPVRDEISTFLADTAFDAVADILQAWLEQAATADDRPRAVHAGSLLLRDGMPGHWDQIAALLTDDPGLAEDIVVAYVANGNVLTVPNLHSHPLAELFLWIQDHFVTPEHDPRFRERITITPRQRVEYLNNAILRHLVDAGTDEAVAAVETIADASPGDEGHWLRVELHLAREARNRQTWTPPTPSQLRRLATPKPAPWYRERGVRATVIATIVSIVAAAIIAVVTTGHSGPPTNNNTLSNPPNAPYCPGTSTPDATSHAYLTFLAELATDQRCWAQNVSPVPPGSTVKYLITYQNTSGQPQRQVTLRVSLNRNLLLTPNTTRVADAAIPDGELLSSNRIVEGGVDLGNFGPHADAFVTFDVGTPAADDLSCGYSPLVSGASVTIASQTWSSNATINVDRTC